MRRIQSRTTTHSSSYTRLLLGWFELKNRTLGKVLDFNKIPWNPPKTFDSSGQNRLFKFDPGAFSSDCQVDTTVVNDFDKLFGQENRFSRAFWTNFQGGDTTECDVVINHPVVIIARHEAWNLYHQLGEWVNAFTTLQVLDKLESDTQLLLLDMHETLDPFADMLKVFSPNHPVLLGKELVEKGKVCLSDAIMPWEGYGSFINVNVWRAKAGEPCINSDILDGFAHYTLNKLGILQKAIPNTPMITLILRKDYMGRSISRKIKNEKEVVSAIKEVSKGRASFRTLHLEELSFVEQLEVIYSQTNILIGVHGGGLAHTIFLPPEAILIELLPQSMENFAYFRNMAKQTNHIYTPLIVSDSIQVDIAKLKTIVEVAITISSSFNTQIGKG
jgi:hypothetical protein